MLGEITRIPRTDYVDDLTGVAMTRLTPPSDDYHHLYFTNPSFTSDGKTIVIASNRGGKWDLHRLELATGDMCKLTEGGIDTHGACLDPVRRVAYYFVEGALHSVDIDSIEDKELYEVPRSFKPGIVSASSCGRYLAFVYTETLPSSTSSGQIYSGMQEYYFQHPRSVVVRFDLQEGRPAAIWGETNWISHVQISPVDPDIVLFCHEGAHRVKQRMWVVNARTTVCRPLYDQRPNEHVGHEYFLKDGRVMTQLMAYRDEGKCFTGDPGIHYSLLINIDGTGERKFRLPSYAPRHIQSNRDASLHVGDCAFLTSDYPDAEQTMSLLRHVEDRVEISPFCRHGGDFTHQLGHPHPIFSPDDRQVLFTSNAGGKCGVYLATVPDRF